MILGQESYIFKAFFWIHKVLTTFYISEVIIFMLLCAGTIIFLSLIKSSGVAWHIFKDKIFFMNTYLFYMGLEKKDFVRSFFYITKTELKKYAVIVIIVLTVAILLFAFMFYVIPNYAPTPPTNP